MGDNVVTTSENTLGTMGKSILQTLESVELDGTEDLEARFQVQWVIRPKDEDNHDYRGYPTNLSGSYKVGDKVTILLAKIENHFG